MAKAKMITDEALDRLLDVVAETSPNPERDMVIILLSCKAGLRAQEIAGLVWRNVTDVSGNLTNVIEVPAGIAKKGHARTVPMHPVLEEALQLLREKAGTITGKTPIVRSARGGEAMTPNNMAQSMLRLYRHHGLDASSHSGRRTVITKLARAANEHGCSLFDVQRIAGHSHIGTTERYVVHADSVHKLMESV